MTATLYLIPTPLGDAATPSLLPHERALLTELTDFVVEAEKTARAHLKHLNLATPIQQLKLSVLNEHTPNADIATLLQPLREGRNLGLMSEAGCPAVADPGARLVALAHQHGFIVQPLIGPSSIMLALMASGANGQSFAFHGYLPADKTGRIATLRQLEQQSRQTKQTQIFIETPYRNKALLEDAVASLSPTTLLCTATDLTLPTQTIISRPIAQWHRHSPPELHKRPTVFVLFAH